MLQPRPNPWRRRLSNALKSYSASLTHHRSIKPILTPLHWPTVILRAEGYSPGEVTHVNLILADMNDFNAVNEVYKKVFSVAPPTRACLALPMAGRRLVLEAICTRDCSEVKRRALHVQGISYWAPANIGPYSQAVTVCFLCCLNIPLLTSHPHSLATVPSLQGRLAWFLRAWLSQKTRRYQKRCC